mmetsp:Transcript_17255/g.51826  ORF Transcript_17255/g.51826 Transcript_17255/m.51826 type:complete len:257 (+) Transcript_17255:409-1179(+)
MARRRGRGTPPSACSTRSPSAAAKPSHSHGPSSSSSAVSAAACGTALLGAYAGGRSVQLYAHSAPSGRLPACARHASPSEPSVPLPRAPLPSLSPLCCSRNWTSAGTGGTSFSLRRNAHRPSARTNRSSVRCLADAPSGRVNSSATATSHVGDASAPRSSRPVPPSRCAMGSASASPCARSMSRTAASRYRRHSFWQPRRSCRDPPIASSDSGCVVSARKRGSDSTRAVWRASASSTAVRAHAPSCCGLQQACACM